MSENIKYYSEMERYEIININDGDKYSCLSNNDIVIDDQGNMKILLLNDNRSKFSIFSKNNFLEIPWEFVKKIGSRTIIVDVDENYIRKTQ